jgi:hypothetical protein
MMEVYRMRRNAQLVIPLAACLAFALFSPTARADLSASWDDAVGHHASVTASIDASGILTVILTNTSPVATNLPALALQGVFFDLTGTGTLSNPTADGDMVVIDRDGPDAISVDQDLRAGWGYWHTASPPSGFFNFGIAAAGLSGLPWTAPKSMDGSRILDGPPFGMVALGEYTEGNSERSMETNNPWTYGTATFTFAGAGDLTLGDTAVFAFGTAPEFVTPLPGAVLLGMLGMGAAGWRLRRFA